MQNSKNALVEIEHLKLELQNGRTQHFRSFIDQYYCYKNGYVNRNGKAKWNDLFWKEFVSEEANKTTDKKLVTKEHVVPLKVITSKLQCIPREDITIDTIRKVLDKYIVFATITKAEDKLLRDEKLNSKMPDEYYNTNSLLYNDLFARYKKVGIKYKKL